MEIAKRKRAEKEKLKRLLGYEKCSLSSICCDSAHFLHFGPDGTVLPKSYAQWALFVRQMTVRSDDTWLVSPQFGMKWAEELVWLLSHDLNLEEGAITKDEKILEEKFPLLELSVIQNCFDESKRNKNFEKNDNENITSGSSSMTSMEMVDRMLTTTSPRYIRSHLPLTLLPQQFFDKQPKIIYVTTDPRDASMSQYNFSVTHYGYKRSVHNFMANFVADHALYSPFWRHLQGFYGLHKNSWPNLLFITHEEMKRDPKSVILKTAKFLHKEDKLVGQNSGNLNKLLDHIKKIEEAQTEKGEKKVEQFSPEICQKFDEWIEKNQIPCLF